MNNAKFYDDALELVKQAVEADTKKDYPNAIALYGRAIERFIAGLKFEKDPTRKTMIEAKAIEYMNRAEALKTAVDEGKPGGIQGGPGGATMAKPTDGKADGAGDDAEAAKLKSGLNQAIVAEKPNVKWDDVAGLELAKDALKEAVILPAKFPQLFTGNRKPWKGILLYGPPGTGKSYLAKAVATEADSVFFAVSSSDLVSKWQGESEKLVRNMFEMARDKKPSIVFIDEVDSLCSSRGEGGSENASRRGILTEFLVQMQGVGKSNDGVLVLAATNTPWEIDAAMRRRFEKRIYIPLPEPHARAAMFKIHLGDTPHNLADADFKELGALSGGFSGSDVSVAVREALMEPLRKCRTAKFWRPLGSGKLTPVMEDPPCSRCPLDLSSAPAPRKVPCRSCGCLRMTLYDLSTDQLLVPDVCMEDFRQIMTRTKGSVADKELRRYEEWTKEFGVEGA